MKKLKFIILIFLMLLTLNMNASKIESVKDGLWSKNSTWNNTAPSNTTCYDTIIIHTNHTVKIKPDIDISSCQPVYIILDGTLKLVKTGFFTYYNLYLPDGSAISVSSSGSIKGKDGFLGSTKIYAGNDVIYDKRDGNVYGPDYIAQDGTTLPIELLSYDYNYDTKKLSWVSASELNNDYYTILIMKVDGTYVSKTINGAGTTSNITKYSVLINQSDCYIYVKQTDYDGKEEELFVLYIKKDKNNKIKIYPNPANNIIYVENININNINIYNMYGIHIKNYNIISDNKIDISNLKKGTYFIIDNKNNIIRFIKI